MCFYRSYRKYRNGLNKSAWKTETAKLSGKAFTSEQTNYSHRCLRNPLSAGTLKTLLCSPESWCLFACPGFVWTVFSEELLIFWTQRAMPTNRVAIFKIKIIGANFNSSTLESLFLSACPSFVWTVCVLWTIQSFEPREPCQQIEVFFSRSESQEPIFKQVD